MSKKSSVTGYRTALCGILTALAVTVMLIAPLFPIMIYCCCLISGVCVALAAEEFGAEYGAFVYIAASVLCALLAADKDAAASFILLIGVYPVVKKLASKLSRAACAVVKLMFVNAASVLYYFAAVKLIGVPADSFGKFPVLMLIPANAVMIMYDLSLNSLIVLYNKKLRKKIMKGKL